MLNRSSACGLEAKCKDDSHQDKTMESQHADKDWCGRNE